MTAFGAAAFKYKPTGLRAHAHAEPVRFGAAAIVGLKSPLHAIYLLINVSTEKIKTIGSRLRLSRLTQDS